MCMSVYGFELLSTVREDGIRIPGAGVASSFEQPDMVLGTC